MANRFVLNETSYHGKGAIQEIATEVKARGAKVIMLTREAVELENREQWDAVYELPALRDELMVFPAVVVLQLMAFYVSRDKGLDVDKPRNLAKVVTVE